jgi:hypothetical protein
MADDDDSEPDAIETLWVVSFAYGASKAEQKATPISAERWAEVVSQDSSLQPIDHLISRRESTGVLSEVPRPKSARWTGHPAGLRVTFSHRQGRVELACPDPEDPETDTTGFVVVDEPSKSKAADLAVLLAAKLFVEAVEIPVWHDTPHS